MRTRIAKLEGQLSTVHGSMPETNSLPERVKHSMAGGADDLNHELLDLFDRLEHAHAPSHARTKHTRMHACLPGRPHALWQDRAHEEDGDRVLGQHRYRGEEKGRVGQGKAGQVAVVGCGHEG